MLMTSPNLLSWVFSLCFLLQSFSVLDLLQFPYGVSKRVFSFISLAPSHLSSVLRHLPSHVASPHSPRSPLGLLVSVRWTFSFTLHASSELLHRFPLWAPSG